MKSKRFRGIAAVLAVAIAGLLAWPAVTASQIRTGNAFYYFFQAVNENDEPFTTEGAVRCSIYDRSSGGNAYIAYTTSALLHNNTTVSFGGQNINGSYTLPLASNRNGLVHWYSASSDPVNVKCFTQYGDYAYKNALRIETHKVRIDTSGSYKISRFPYLGGQGTPVLTGIVIPAGGLITDIAVEKVTGASATAHLNVGFTGNHVVATRNALVSAINVNNPGFTMVHVYSSLGFAAPAGAALTHSSVYPADNTLRFPTTYLVHVNSGLEVTYDTSAGVGPGGHVYIFWRSLHVGFNSQPLN